MSERDGATIHVLDEPSGGLSAGNNEVAAVADTKRGWATTTVRLATASANGSLAGDQGDNSVDIQSTTGNGSALGDCRETLALAVLL